MSEADRILWNADARMLLNNTNVSFVYTDESTGKEETVDVVSGLIAGFTKLKKDGKTEATNNVDIAKLGINFVNNYGETMLGNGVYTAKISADYEGKEIKLICILKGSIFFCCELAKRITVPVKIDFMQTSSYGSGTTSSGNIVIKKELDESIEGEHVIVVEDIIDSGNTLFRLMPMLEERNPADICICTLLDKPDRREVDIDVKYNGFNIPDEFVVGYGLDYDQMYRNLPFIGVVHLDDEN